jgi:hypothetical protein
MGITTPSQFSASGPYYPIGCHLCVLELQIHHDAIPAELIGDHHRRAASAERIEHQARHRGLGRAVARRFPADRDLLHHACQDGAPDRERLSQRCDALQVGQQPTSDMAAVMARLGISGGKVAKWVPGNDTVLICQTLRIFRFSVGSQIADPIASFTADGDYDQDRVSQAVAERHPDAAVIVPPRAGAVESASAETRHSATVTCG